MDLIDKKILSELDFNSRIPLTQLAKKLRISREKANYRLTQLINKGIIKNFVTQIDSTKLGYQVFKLFIKLQNISLETKKDLISFLIKDKYVYWIAECKGPWDLNITIYAKDIHHFDDAMQSFYEQYSVYIAKQEFNITLEVGALQKNWDLKSNRDLRILFAEKENYLLSDTEQKLLSIIADESRISIITLANDLKITPRVASNILKKLEKRKIILGYSISMDYEQLKKQFFKTTISFNTLNKTLKKKIREYCKSRENIIYYIFCVGSWSLELEFIVKNNEEFYFEIDNFRAIFSEVKDYEVMLLSKEHKFAWVPSE